MNRLSDAIQLLRERRKAAPKDYLVNWFLAEALNRDGVSPGTPEEDEAIGALREAVGSNPKAEQARVLLGKFLFKRGDIGHAIEQLTRALELDPGDSSATYQLAQAYRKKGDARRADELFAKVSQEKAEAREQFTQRNLVRIIREGAQ
jgi:predicted Zn-dependent protease